MRAVKLHLHDCELFYRSLDVEKHALFSEHLLDFKRMWTEEGKVYWLRFLITFKMYFESCLNLQMSRNKLGNFIFIFIHKQFVEGSFSTAKNFIDNIFMIAKLTPYLPETTFMKQATHCTFYPKRSKEPYRALFGKSELDDDIPVGMSFVSSVYFEFASAICALLKKWLQEADLSEELKSEIDRTLFYWRPSEWKDIGCFEKYLADNWKNDLPKALLTHDIHKIFSNHPTDCCNFEKYTNIFELLKEDLETVHRLCIPHAEILKPSIGTCSAHSDCLRKILHDKKCLQPYLCEGSEPCVLTCEISLKKRQQSKEINLVNPWKSFIVETFACQEANRRSVSTLAESHCVETETFYRDKESTCEMVKEGFISNEDAEDLLRLYTDGDARNALNQLKRKEHLMNRLRSKLDKKANFDPENLKEPYYRWNLYQRGHQAWIHDMFTGKIEDTVLPQDPNIDKTKIKNSSGCPRRASLSVAVGTKDVIYGRVVYPFKLLCQPERKVTVCEAHTQKLRDSEDKKSKSKKMKGNLNGILSIREDNGSANSGLKTTSKVPATGEISQNCKAVPKDSIKYATAVDNLEKCYEVGFKIPLTEAIKNSKGHMLKKSPSVTKCNKLEECSRESDAVVSLLAGKALVFKSCKSLSESKVSSNGEDYERFNGKKGMAESTLNAAISNDANSQTDDSTNKHILTFIGALNKPFSLLQSKSSFKEPASLDSAGNDFRENKRKLRICAHCGEKEVQSKTFKRCAQCKVEKFRKQRYYCSRDCQSED